MAYLQLKSNNPDFSYIIRKNPSAGLMLKGLRKGILFGWFTGEDTYNIFFKDSQYEISFKKHEDEVFEYLNVSRYTSPLFVTNAIKELLESAYKEEREKDISDEFTQEFFINTIEIKSVKYLTLFKKHFPWVQFDEKEVAKDTYRMRLTTRESLHKLLNFVNIFAFFCAITNRDTIFIDEMLIEKYISSLAKLDVPYFVKYLFKINFLGERDKFDKFKEKLEESKTESIELTFLTTHHARRQSIRELLSFDKPIIDVGCGEGFYVMPFADQLKDKPYYAIDPDEEMRDIVTKKAESKQMDTVTVYSSFHEFKEQLSEPEESYDILLTEVIEHMSEDGAKNLISEILDFGHINKFIVTTPNKDFNQFYFSDLDEKRHEGHIKEYTEEEFKDLISSVFDASRYVVRFIKIGDKVNGIATTSGALIQRKDEL